MSSTANDLASGSQDLAALLGLFCTDGVERNALAYNFGWGTVVASSLSLLGVLGLLKSSIKLALGLKYCQQAGFNLDSVRGIFGYLPGESPATGSLLECGVVLVKLSSSGMSITKSRRYFSGANTPIVNYAGGSGSIWDHQIAVNLGNLAGENAWRQSFVVTILALIVCSGLTSWLLEIVRTEWTWVKFIAVPGLHACLVLLVGLPLYYDRQLNRPAHLMTFDIWDALQFKGTITSEQREVTLNLLQVHDKTHEIDVLHAQGNTAFLESNVTKGCLMILSVFAATAYICQYAIIKGASSTRALIWLSCQGALAAARLAYWIFDPSFDDSTVIDSEYVRLNVTGSETLTMSELICNFEFSEQALKLPDWALSYLLSQPLRSILQSAAVRTESDVIPPNAKFCALRSLNLRRILSHRWIKDPNPNGDSLHLIVLGLYRDEIQSTVVPFIMIEAGYVSAVTETVHAKPCLVEATWPSRSDNEGNIRSICTMFAIDKETGYRLHLRSYLSIDCDENCAWDQTYRVDCDDENTWKFIIDRSRVCRFLQTITKPESNDFDMKSTPGWENCVNIGGPEGKQRGRERPRVTDYATGLRLVRDYMVEGVSKRGRFWKKAGRWLCGLISNGGGQRQEDGNPSDTAASKA